MVETAEKRGLARAARNGVLQPVPSEVMHTHEGSPLRRAVDHAAHLLPAQGPIGVFVHHNTLHAFQHEPFEQAVVKAAEIFGAEPFMSEAAYQRQFKAGRIKVEDVDWALEQEPNGECLAGGLDRRALHRAMLLGGMRTLDELSLPYLLEEAGFASESEEARALWAVGFGQINEPELKRRQAARPREGVLWKGGPDLDDQIHPILIRLCAVFLDQGMSPWPMPERERGFYPAVRELLAQPVGSIRRTRADWRRSSGARQRPP